MSADQISLFDPRRQIQQITLRPYQRAAVDALYNHLRTRDDSPCIVMPTGSGKSPTMAAICRDAAGQWKSRVLILAHVKELLEQAADKLRATCPGIPVGLYSAGLGRKEVTRPITVAGIQSIYKRACDLDPFDLVLIDEAHLISPEGDGMYRQFLAEAKIVNPQLRICGFTATPFRMKSGPICSPDGFLNHICFEVGVRELIVDGYLSPLVTKAGSTKVDTSELNVRGGEFAPDQVESLMDRDELVESACGEIVSYAAERKSVLIFGAGVEHARHIAAVLTGMDRECGIVCGETADRERADLLRRFRDGELKYLTNFNVLTTGFDAPNIDCVALMRPTNSPGLYYQMVGRGFRISPTTGKQDCLVLDFGGNVVRHGPVDRLDVTAPRKAGGSGGESPAKECPKCNALIAAGFGVCPECGYEFPPPERPAHDATASDAGILSGQITTTEYEVSQIWYSVHRKHGSDDDAPRTMRVDYLLGDFGETKSEWVCFEHDGFARQKAETWWKKRSPDPIPESSEEAVKVANEGGVAEAKKITVRKVAGEKFERIIDYVLGAMPGPLIEDDESGSGAEPVYAPGKEVAYDDDIPF